MVLDHISTRICSTNSHGDWFIFYILAVFVSPLLDVRLSAREFKRPQSLKSGKVGEEVFIIDFHLHNGAPGCYREHFLLNAGLWDFFPQAIESKVQISLFLQMLPVWKWQTAPINFQVGSLRKKLKKSNLHIKFWGGKTKSTEQELEKAEIWKRSVTIQYTKISSKILVLYMTDTIIEWSPVFLFPSIYSPSLTYSIKQESSYCCEGIL